MYTAEQPEAHQTESVTTQIPPTAKDAIASAADESTTGTVTPESVVAPPQDLTPLSRDETGDLTTTITSTLGDPARKNALRARFEATIANPRFWAKESRITALEDATLIPVFDDKSLQQFFNHAMADLESEAARKSSKDSLPAVLPTEEEGKAEAWRRYIAQAKKQITKQLKKEEKTPTEDSIQTLLNAHLATLSDKQD